MPTVEELSQQFEILNQQVQSIDARIKDLEYQIKSISGGSGSSGSGGDEVLSEITRIKNKLASLSAYSGVDFEAKEQSKNTNAIIVSQPMFYIMENDPKTAYYEMVNPEMIQINLENYSSIPSASESTLVYALEGSSTQAYVLSLGGWLEINQKSYIFNRS